MKSFHVLFVLLCWSIGLVAQDNALNKAQIELQKLQYDPALKHGSMAFMAINMDNGAVIAEHDPFKSMVPASIQKLFTTYVALETLGADHTFKTTFGHTGTVKDGTLSGNLVVIGGGDPTLVSRYFPSSTLQPFADYVTQAGITKVDGRLEVDLSYFASHNTPRGWMWEDMGNYFGATPTSVMWMDNLLEVKLRSGQEGTRATVAEVAPKLEGLEMDIQVEAANSKRDNAWFFGAPGSDKIYAKGSIPMHRQSFTVKAANPKVSESFSKALLAQTKLLGTEIRMVQKPTSLQMVESVTVSSPPLLEIVRLTNQKSINLFAEALLLHLDQRQEQRSTEGGLAGLENYLREKKISLGGTRFIDGSGLSPLNRMTCQTMIELLTQAYRSEGFEAFKSSLPIAGQSGTLASSFKGSKLEGKVMAKSGTMSGVRNYAGYLINDRGETVAFCIMLNDYDAKRKGEVMAKIQTVLEGVMVD